MSFVLDWHQNQAQAGFNHFSVSGWDIPCQTKASNIELGPLERVPHLLTSFNNAIGIGELIFSCKQYGQISAASPSRCREELGGVSRDPGMWKMDLSSTATSNVTIAAESARVEVRALAIDARSVNTSLRRSMSALRILFLGTDAMVVT